ncbi:MAG: TatD family hydrolase, partial [Patescibacteria group bacterium]
MIIDTHVHYNLEPLSSDWRMYWRHAQEIGVVKSIVIGTDSQSCKVAIEIAQQEQNLYATVGIHPDECADRSNNDMHMTVLKNLLDRDRDKHHKIVAVGECGLDYYRLPTDLQEQVLIKQNQKMLFELQIILAHQYNLPVIIHCRDTRENAYNDVLSILKVHPGTQFVLHCMSGSREYLQEALKLGGYISFAANLTYRNAAALRNLAKNTLKNRILLETDAPFLPPQNKRG